MFLEFLHCGKFEYESFSANVNWTLYFVWHLDMWDILSVNRTNVTRAKPTASWSPSSHFCTNRLPKRMNRSEDHRELQTETDLAQATGQLQDTQCNPFSPIPQRKPGDWKLAKFSLTNDEIDLTQLWPKPAPLPSCSCSLSFLAPRRGRSQKTATKGTGILAWARVTG